MSKQIQKAKTSPAPRPAETSNSRYLKRSEVEAARQAAYAAEQARLEAEREDPSCQEAKTRGRRSRARERRRNRLAEESRARREEDKSRQERLRRKRLWLPGLPGKDEGSKEGTPLDDGEGDISEDELPAKLRELDEPALLFGESHRAGLRRHRKLTQRALTPKLSDGPIPTTLELV
jgi:pre-mRNA-splicing factor 18